jgi:hypothetical protein
MACIFTRDTVTWWFLYHVLTNTRSGNDLLCSHIVEPSPFLLSLFSGTKRGHRECCDRVLASVIAHLRMCGDESITRIHSAQKSHKQVQVSFLTSFEVYALISELPCRSVLLCFATCGHTS